MKAQLITAALSLLVASAANAAPGDLDPSFNGVGYVADTSLLEPRADAVCVDGGNRILVAGGKRLAPTINSWQTVLGGYSSSGALDPAFNWRPIGVSAPTIPIPSMVCIGSTVAVTSVQPVTNNQFDVRLDFSTANGSFWTSHLLNSEGLTTTNPRIALVAPLSNRFLVGPTIGGPSNRIAVLQRWDGSGSAMPSYQGTFWGPFGIYTSAMYTDAYTDSSGNVFAIGRVAGNGTQGTDTIVSSFTSAGYPRASFGVGGTVSYATALDDYGQRIARSGFNGWTYIGIAETGGPSPQVRVLRLTASGSVDGSFGATVLANAELGDLIEDSQGRVLIVGNKSGGAAFVRRVNSDGSPDASFGPNGERIFGFGSLTARFGGVTLDGQGRIIVVGHRESAVRGGATVAAAMIVARLLP